MKNTKCLHFKLKQIDLYFICIKTESKLEEKCMTLTRHAYLAHTSSCACVPHVGSNGNECVCVL